MRARVLVIVGSMLSVTMWIGVHAAQDAARFEVASVKANVGSDLSIPIRPFPADGIVLTNYPLVEIIRYAYDNVQPFRLEGVPGWARDERFDIAAKAAGPISDTERRRMMRTLLAERFRMKSRTEMRDRMIYVMTLARADKQLGPGVKPRPDCASSPCDTGGGSRPDAIRIRAISMARLADGTLSFRQGALVRDETGVPGVFDIEMTWRPDSAGADDARPEFFTALREQLGLKLEPQRAPVEILIVESIDRPTPD